MKPINNCKHCKSPATEFPEGSYWLYYGCTKCGIRTHVHGPGTREQIAHLNAWNNSDPYKQGKLFDDDNY